MARAVAPPTVRVTGFARNLALSAFWFGLNFHWIPMLTVLVPFQARGFLGEAQQGVAVAFVTAIGAIPATLVPPLVGYWSDRLRTRWGRRRPIIFVGTIVNVVGLGVMWLAPNYVVMVIGYLVVQFSNNSAGAAYNAVVPDVVPEEDFGKASGVIGAMVQLGSAFGLGAVVAVALLLKLNPTIDYVVIAVVITLTMIPTLLVTRGEGLGAIEIPPPKPFREALAEFIRPLHTGDFAWVIATRTFITAGIYTLLPFLQFFFVDVVKVGEANAVSFTGTWQLILLLVATPFGLAGGWLSDRLGRKPFVYASGGLQALVLVVFIVLYPTSPILVILLGALYGVGYGLYYAVDWALACDTLPDKSKSAKDMGLFHVSFTLPQVLLPAVMGPILDHFNHVQANSGYRVVFSAAIVFFVLGTVLVSRIKGVR